ncbi:MAG: hypothetical protein ACI8RD_011216, partial [Bacillariaceae sp.]|jgi:hypothetical protein
VLQRLFRSFRTSHLKLSAKNIPISFCKTGEYLLSIYRILSKKKRKKIETKMATPVIDWDEAMQQCGDDEEFLRELLGDLRTETDTQMSQMEIIIQVRFILLYLNLKIIKLNYIQTDNIQVVVRRWDYFYSTTYASFLLVAPIMQGATVVFQDT